MPVRVVVDSMGRTPVTSALVLTSRQGPVLIATTKESKGLQSAGCEVWVGPAVDGRVDLQALMAELGRRQMTNIFVEGGGRLLGSFFEAGLVDRVVAFVAPQVLGGENALTPVEGAGAPTVERALRMRWTKVRRVGGDLMMVGEVLRERPRS
jgi:diaminohydroxyphosphoribosylaminopyrimidine deaminase/5-amino-6-(5-phosphoribosylamino)uracil reductase